MISRKITTDFLSKLLCKEKLIGIGKHYAREVTADYGTGKAKRVDFMQFVPDGQCSVSALEKGIFVCYEIKSCKEDVYSGNGLNFLGEKNYIITTLECGKELLTDIRSGKLKKYIQEHYPDSSTNFGIMVAVRGAKDGFYDGEITVDSDVNKWYLKTIANCRTGLRRKSIVELLFCMLRAKGD